MGQLITRPEGGIEKTDINVYYATYGEGDTYAMDGNEEYYTAEENCGHMDKEDAALSKVANFANFVFKKCVLQDPEKGQQTKSRCVCIFMVCIVMFVCIGGGTAFYFLQIVPSSIGLSQNVTNSSLTRSSLDFTVLPCFAVLQLKVDDAVCPCFKDVGNTSRDLGQGVA